VLFLSLRRGIEEIHAIESVIYGTTAVWLEEIRRLRLLCGDPWMKAVQTSKLAAEGTVGTRHDRGAVLSTALPSLDMGRLAMRLATSPEKRQ